MKRSLARFRLSLLRASAPAPVSTAVSVARYPGSSRKSRPNVIMQRTSVDEPNRSIGDGSRSRGRKIEFPASIIGNKVEPEFIKRSVFDGGARLSRQVEIEMQVVQGD